MRAATVRKYFPLAICLSTAPAAAPVLKIILRARSILKHTQQDRLPIEAFFPIYTAGIAARAAASIQTRYSSRYSGFRQQKMKSQICILFLLGSASSSFAHGCYKADPKAIFDNLKDAEKKVADITIENENIYRTMKHKEEEMIDERDNIFMLSFEASVSKIELLRGSCC